MAPRTLAVSLPRHVRHRSPRILLLAATLRILHEVNNPMNCHSLVAAVVLFTLVVAVRAEDPKPSTGKVRIVLTGDSTVATSTGWGTAFIKLLGPEAEGLNQAKGGASTKSYIDSHLWERAIALQPAWVLIQFGHNDQPGKGPERETDPGTTYSANLRKFIDEARAVGAQPVLITSLVRRGNIKDGHLTSDLEPYAQAARNVAAEKQVPLVDLHARSKDYVEKMSAEDLAAMNPQGKTPGIPDYTHLTVRGGEMIAPLVVAELRKVAPELARLIPEQK
jgi:lysophospholipase L1-like esterase